MDKKKSKKTIIRQPFYGTKITYIRDDAGQPIAVVAVHRTEGEPEHLAIGVSIRHRNDPFNRDMGRNIAMGRAVRLQEKFAKNDQIGSQPYAIWAYDVDYRGGWDTIFNAIIEASDAGNIALPRRVLTAVRRRLPDMVEEAYTPKLSLVPAPVN